MRAVFLVCRWLPPCYVLTWQRKLWCVFLLLSLSVMSDSLRPHGLACQASLAITNPQSLLKLMSIELVIPANHLILCHPLLLLPSIFPSIRVFSNRWPKCWSLSFSNSPFNEYSGLISFRIDLFDLLAVIF